MRSTETLGFIGLGVMGEPMCANLIAKSKKPVYGADLKREPIERLAARGLKACGSIAEVAAAADIIFLSLPTGAEVEQVCDAILAARGRTHTIVDMSTSPAALMADLAARLAGHGIAFADAPVARTRQAAHDGTLSIMVGGSADVFAAIRPYLACMGTEITHCGQIGSGQVVKCLNNMVLFMTVQALAEALAIGRGAGVDGRLLFEVMSKGSADSFAVRNQGLNALVPGAFPSDAFPTEYALKDIGLALELAGRGGVSADGAQLTRDILERTREAGFGKAYYPAMLKVIEGRSQT